MSATYFSQASLLPRVRPACCPRSFLGVAVSFRKNSNARLPHRTIIEIERKFPFDPTLVAGLLSKSRPGPFEAVRDLGGRTFTDEYFDDADSSYPLTTRDVWLRVREGVLQMKIHTESGTTSGIDTFLEVVGAKDVADRLERYSAEGVIRTRAPPDAAPGPFFPRERPHLTRQDIRRFLRACYNLTPFCSITTSRKSFVLDDRFRLDLDAADFGHHVGELELVVPLPPGASPERRAEIVRAAEREVANFCERHAWFFEAKRPSRDAREAGDDRAMELGKLTAYIKRFNPEQWKALMESGVLKNKLFPTK